MRRLVFCLGFGGALLLVAFGQALVELKVQPLFGTAPAANGAFPMAVQLESRSGNYRGVLSVSVGEFGSRREYLYPIDLPAGSRKVVIATPIVGRYGDRATIRFTARGVSVEVIQDISRVIEADQLAVLVGDAIGGLQVLRQVNTAENPLIDYQTNQRIRGKYEVAYCRAELFPEQSIALSGTQMIVLSSGAERLRAEQWDALRRWVLLGGVLVVPGGAGAVYLQNPALQPILPVRVRGTRSVSQLESVGRWTGARAPDGSATVSEAQLTEGATLLSQDGLPMIAVRPYGLGAVVFLAFNPLEQPMRDYDARARFWQRLADTVPSYAPSFSIAAIHQHQSGYQVDPWSGRSQIASDVDLDPPSVLLIVVLLSLYFMLVVPVNYWVLKRLRALDWAWVVTPLIALAFVGILWRLAGDLYRKSLSSKVQTVIVAQSGSPDAYSINSVLFFFPRAGLFDLQFDQTDMVEAGLGRDFGRGMPQTTVVRTVQGEPTRMEGYRVSSLSFQWFRYTRAVSLQGRVEGVLRLEQQGGQAFLSGTLRNRLPYDLTELRILTPVGEVALGDLKARGTLSIGRKPLRPLQVSAFRQFFGWWETPSLSPDALVSFLLHRREFKGGAILVARAAEPVLTPEIDQAAERAARVTYLISFPLEGR
ncbi:MAG: hypothetical protein NZ874_04955 [Fimbriimonadales bacterium]|nr:hypothetical protein [Fimbriimonadales bacterium]